MGYFNGTQNKRDVEENWQLISSFLERTVKKNIPSKMSRARKTLPWVTDNISRMIRRRNRLHALFKKTQKDNIYKDWVELRSRIKKEVYTSHMNYINGMIGDIKTDSKPFWRYINGQRRDKHSIPPLQTTENKLAIKDIDKAAAFNHQFSSAFTNTVFNSIPFRRPVCGKMADITISTHGVEKLMKGLKPNKAMGPDNIHPWVLRELATELAPMMSHLFQQSLIDGRIPKDWKGANVCPVYKKGVKSLPVNYRPVSLTCICCKLLEHIVSSNLMGHFEANNILSPRQHAFRKSHSCETQLVSVIEDWASSLDSKKQVDVFILDFEKAFDTVPHELLKTKLFSLGVSKQVLCWVDNFLSDRTQAVVVNGTKSNYSNVVSGVPQGSVLGPILFLVHINDIANTESSDVRLFADDCVCYRVIEDVNDCHTLQSDISKLGQWADAWGMKFQPVKCKIMSISRKHNPIYVKYVLNGVELTRVNCIKYLGVDITNDLSWGKHIQGICNKGNRILGVFYRNLSFCPRDVKLAAYKGLLRPVLEYASSVWDPHQIYLRVKLESVQRRAARFIASEYSRDPGTMTSLLEELDLALLADRRKNSRIILFAKGVHGQASVPTAILRHPTRRTRNMHDMHFCQLSTRTNCYTYSFLPNTIKDWNGLSPDIICKSIEHHNPVKYISEHIRT